MTVDARPPQPYTDPRLDPDGTWHGLEGPEWPDMDPGRHNPPTRRPACRVNVTSEGLDSRNPRWTFEAFHVWCDNGCSEFDTTAEGARTFVMEHEGLLDDEGRVAEASRRRAELTAAFVAVVEGAARRTG